MAQYITVRKPTRAKRNIIMSEANNIISLPSESKTRYNTLQLAGKETCKTDEIFLVRFDFDMKLLYGRHHNRRPFIYGTSVHNRLRHRVLNKEIWQY